MLRSSPREETNLPDDPRPIPFGGFSGDFAIQVLIVGQPNLAERT